jgi:hypothetical protein
MRSGRPGKHRLLIGVLVLLGLGAIVAVFWAALSSWQPRGDLANPDRRSPGDPPTPEGTPVDIEIVRRSVGLNGVLVQFIERFHDQVGRYPLDLGVLMKSSQVDKPPKWRGPYLSTSDLLLDPWGRPYRYQAPGTHNEDSYDLWSVGLDGVEGTQDDIGNW